MIAVFRIQDREGKGPYASDILRHVRECPFYDEDIRNRHPLPDDDGLRFSLMNVAFRGEMVFAFPTLRALNQWFSPATKDWIIDKGYKIYRVMVASPCVVNGRSGTQILFLRRNAKCPRPAKS